MNLPRFLQPAADRPVTSRPMKFSICNETWQDTGWGHDLVCERIAAHGYDGVEIAPFTLNPNPAGITEAEAVAIVKAMVAGKIGVSELDGRPHVTVQF